MESPAKILVIDDDLIDRLAVKRALAASDLTFVVQEAGDGDSALKLLATMLFDCIILDYRLAETDGLTLLQAIRAQHIETPVVMLTGQGDEQIAVEIMKAGAHDYLSKGVLSPGILVQRVQNAIRVYHAELETRQVEAALRESEMRFRTMADSAPILLWMSDTEGRKMFFNQSWLRFTGRAAEGDLQDTWHADIYPEDVAYYDDAFGQALELRRPLELEYRVRRADGQYRIILETASPRFSNDNQWLGYIGSGVDITQRKHIADSQRFLAEASRVLASSLESETVLHNLMALAVPHLADWCVVDLSEADGTLARTATAQSDPAEVAPDALQRLSASIIRDAKSVFIPHLDTLDGEIADEALRTEITELGITALMGVAVRIRGTLAGAILFAYCAEGKQYEAFDLSVAEDLGVRVSVAIDNARLYQEAQEAIHLRDVFLSVASHELKTPLTSLTGNAQLMERRARRDLILPEREQRTLHTIVQQADRLKRMIEALLDISRIQSGQLSIQAESIDLKPLLIQMTEELESVLENHTLTLRGQAESLPIQGDPLRLDQVFQNLLQNAIKYSPGGGAIEVEYGIREGNAFVAITDQGIGIPANALTNIFGRFYRANNADKRRIAGLGVGLYVVKEIVDLHKGIITISSIEGVGSTFTVMLPLDQVNRLDHVEQTGTPSAV